MPIKYDDIGNNGQYLQDTTPINEKLDVKQQYDAISDMMSNIIDEKQKMKNTSAIDMVGALTSVIYYQIIAESSSNYASSNSAPSDLATEDTKYNLIKDFKVKFNGPIDADIEGEEGTKSYVTSGTITILPRTIKPTEGDLFLVNYYNRKMCYIINTVNVKSFEQDSGYECAFSLYKEDFTPAINSVKATYKFIQELVGTSYRSVLKPEEYENLTKFQKLYKHLSSVYNTLFYNSHLNTYVIKDYKANYSINENKYNINKKTLGQLNGVFRTTINPFVVPAGVSIVDRDDRCCYDNYLNTFIANNQIFRYFDDLLLSINPLLPEDRIGYKRSVFGCMETRSVSNYKNKFVSPIEINVCQPGISPVFVGKVNILHTDKEIEGVKDIVFPQLLIKHLTNGKSIDMTVSCNDKGYDGPESLIIETIVRYVYKSTTDFVDRFKALYERMDELYEHIIPPIDIYYLFPLLGYVLEKTMEELYEDNILLK